MSLPSRCQKVRNGRHDVLPFLPNLLICVNSSLNYPILSVLAPILAVKLLKDTIGAVVSTLLKNPMLVGVFVGMYMLWSIRRPGVRSARGLVAVVRNLHAYCGDHSSHDSCHEQVHHE